LQTLLVQTNNFIEICTNKIIGSVPKKNRFNNSGENQ
jgi:hypothetical protein